MDKDEFRNSVDDKLDSLSEIEKTLDQIEDKGEDIQSDVSDARDSLGEIRETLNEIHAALAGSGSLGSLSFVINFIAFELGVVIYLLWTLQQ